MERDQLGWLRGTKTLVVPGPELSARDPELWMLTLLVRARPSADIRPLVHVVRDVAAHFRGWSARP